MSPLPRPPSRPAPPGPPPACRTSTPPPPRPSRRAAAAPRPPRAAEASVDTDVAAPPAAAASDRASSSPASSSSSSAPPALSLPATVEVDVETAPGNARRLFARVDIAAPPFVVWGALTDYDRLGEFVPGLAENRCLSRGPARATLLQVAEKPLALGLRFRARVVLDIQEHEEGLPASLVADLPASSGDKLAGTAAGLFPLPRAGPPRAGSTRRPRDITFALIEGDFAAFRGVWRIQEGGDEEGGGGGGGGGPATRLAYSLYVRPQPWLPVHLVAARVSSDIELNLAAVKRYAEATWRGE